MEEHGKGIYHIQVYKLNRLLSALLQDYILYMFLSTLIQVYRLRRPLSALVQVYTHLVI